jgi:hypothetical protein
MSAGSAFASGVRAGQNIWNQAVNNAMAGKRLDMLRTQFQYEETKRRTDASNLTKANTGLQSFFKDTSTVKNLLDPQQYEVFKNAQLKAIPVVSLDPEVFKAFTNSVNVINNRTQGESASALVAERGLLATKYRDYYEGQDLPTIVVKGNPPVTDWVKTIEMVKIKEEESAQKSDLRGVDYDIEKEFKKTFPNKQFPGTPTDPLTGTKSEPDYGAASEMVRDEERKREVDKLVDTADSKNEIDFRVGFKKWQRDVVKNPALDPKNPEDQKLYRTFAHDEKIAGLMAEAGLEAFKLQDKLVPDTTAGGYRNIAEVTGMINDLIRKQEEDADTKKAMAQKPLTESQAKDYIFSGRLKLNENVIAELEQDGFKPESIPQDIMMAWLPEFGKTEDQKRYISARANWIAAVLRRESGAAIAESEYKGGFEQYFPLIGDSPQVVRDKRDRRRQVERDMRAISTNQPVMSDYETIGGSVKYDNLNKVQQAVDSGRLKVGDKYKYYDANGLIQDGVVEPGE